MRRICALLAAALLLAAVPTASGQVRTEPPGEAEPLDPYRFGPYRDGVPSPREFLGYSLGATHTEQHRTRAYLRELAEAAPDRISVERYGESYEGRPLLLAFVSSPENLERREEIRRSVRRLADPSSTGLPEAREIAASSPIVVWLDYGNDGNETANMEAAMQVAYQLVAGEGEETRRVREEALVILNPLHNPESRSRHVAFYNAFGIGASDPSAAEHDAPWGMSTNNNHYQIDLNRDKWGLTQRETQAVAAAFLRWRPQVLVDHHGQTEQYFFPPPTLPVNPSLPASHREWLGEFGRGNARAFDRHGWQYYTRDVFDLHYPGYFDSWPSLHGAIGMTYETDGGGSKGLAWERQDGTVVSFRDGIEKHFVASLATVRTAVENREAILRDYHGFFRSGMEAGRAGRPARAYALLPGEDPRRAAVLASTLLRHGIEVRRASREFEARGVGHQSGETASRRFPAGTYVVDMAQPEQRAAETFLARDVPMDSAFVREQIARWARNARRGEGAGKERYEFYDITAWSLPLAFGVDAYALSAVPPATEPVEVEGERLVGTGYWGEELAFRPPWLSGGVTEAIPGLESEGTEGRTSAGEGEQEAAPRARSAYVYRPETEGAARLTARLLAEGFEVAVATRTMMVAEREFPRGTFVARVSRNPDGLHGRIRELAEEAGVEVLAAHTAFPAAGETGPGSGTVLGIEPPRVAVAGDDGVRTTGYGAAWFTLSRRLGYPFTPLRFDAIRRGALEEYDVLVLPESSAGAVARRLGEEGVAGLKEWVEEGGTLVTWGGGAAFAVRNGLTTASFVAPDSAAADSARARELLAEIDALPREEGPLPPFVSPTASPGAPQSVPGAAFRAELDLTHWLTLGYAEPDLSVLVSGDDFLTLSEEGANPAVFPAGERGFTLSGFTWSGNTERLLAGTAWAVVEPVGEGQTVLFQSDPNYRLTWRATGRLFANAVLLGPTMAEEGQTRY